MIRIVARARHSSVWSPDGPSVTYSIRALLVVDHNNAYMCDEAHLIPGDKDGNESYVRSFVDKWGRHAATLGMERTIDDVAWKILASNDMIAACEKYKGEL